MSSSEAVKRAVTRRILIRHQDLFAVHGLDAVVEAIEDLASGYESIQLDEIGTSDVSCWVKDVIASLERRSQARGQESA